MRERDFHMQNSQYCCRHGLFKGWSDALPEQVLEGEGQGILPGHKRTKVVVLMLKEDSDQHEKLTFLQEGLPYK